MGLRSSVPGVHSRHAAGGTAPEDVNCCRSPAERASCEPAPDARGQQPSCQGTSGVCLLEGRIRPQTSHPQRKRMREHPRGHRGAERLEGTPRGNWKDQLAQRRSTLPFELRRPFAPHIPWDHSAPARRRAKFMPRSIFKITRKPHGNRHSPSQARGRAVRESGRAAALR
jgi:hypothetical protein